MCFKFLKRLTTYLRCYLNVPSPASSACLIQVLSEGTVLLKCCSDVSHLMDVYGRGNWYLECKEFTVSEHVAI
jgi:hypothetical protein